MTLKDFLHFPGNRSTSFSARPADVPMSVGSLVGSLANVPDEELEMVVAALVANNVIGVKVVPPSAGRHSRGIFSRPVGSPQRVIGLSLDVDSKACKTLFGSLASTEDPGDSDPFLLGIEEAHSSGDALCNLSYPDVQRPLDGLTLTELTIFHDVAAVRLLSSDHLSFALVDLQKKAMLVGRSQALREVASSSIGVELVDIKDFDPIVEQNYDRAFESFYQV
nr:hypothetical protein [Tanacetum cinerariifolium]